MMRLSYRLGTEEKLRELDDRTQAEVSFLIERIETVKKLSDLKHDFDITAEDSFEGMPVYMIRLNARARLVFAEKEGSAYLLSIISR
jgi:hypothetical protein